MILSPAIFDVLYSAQRSRTDLEPGSLYLRLRRRCCGQLLLSPNSFENVEDGSPPVVSILQTCWRKCGSSTISSDFGWLANDTCHGKWMRLIQSKTTWGAPYIQIVQISCSRGTICLVSHSHAWLPNESTPPGEEPAWLEVVSTTPIPSRPHT